MLASPMPLVRLLYRGMRTTISVVTAGDEKWIEKRLLPFADVEPERILLAREARLHLLFSGAGIVPLKDESAEKMARDAEQCTFFRRHYVEGFSLREHLLAKAQNPLPKGLDSGLSIIRNLAYILMELEKKKSRAGRSLGVVHRDISPGNILIDRRGLLWLNDFGLTHLSSLEVLEQEEMAQGYQPFLSPEQLQGSRLDHKSDIYQVGLLFALLLTPSGPEQESLWRARSAAFGARSRARQILDQHFPQSGLVDCLEEDPSHRPTPTEFFSLVQRLDPGRSR